jgi:hypothetical protein
MIYKVTNSITIITRGEQKKILKTNYFGDVHSQYLNDKLFVHYTVYEYLLDYEMIFVFFYNKKFKEGIENIKKLLNIYKSIPIYIRINIIESIVFYLEYINFDLSLQESYMNFIKDTYKIINNFQDIHIDKIVQTVNKFTSLYDKFNYSNIISNKINNNEYNNSKKIKVFLSITSCKRYDLFIKTIDSFLICCKDIHLIDYFFCIDDNSSDIDRENMLKKYPFFKFYLKTESEKEFIKKAFTNPYDTSKQLSYSEMRALYG